MVPGFVYEERLLDEDDVVLRHPEAVVVGRAVLVPGGDGANDSPVFQDHRSCISQ